MISLARKRRSGRGARGLALAAFVVATPAAAQTHPAAPIAGTLACRIGKGNSVVLGDDRDLVCLFDRPGQTTERYEGLSGIVTAPTTPVGAAQTVTYSVAMPTPEALAALAGDYDGRGVARSGGSAALVGGQGGAVVLRPIDSRATTNLAPLNDILGLSQLHLNYAGRVPAPARRSARRDADR